MGFGAKPQRAPPAPHGEATSTPPAMPPQVASKPSGKNGTAHYQNSRIPKEQCSLGGVWGKAPTRSPATRPTAKPQKLRQQCHRRWRAGKAQRTPPVARRAALLIIETPSCTASTTHRPTGNPKPTSRHRLLTTAMPSSAVQSRGRILPPFARCRRLPRRWAPTCPRSGHTSSHACPRPRRALRRWLPK